MNVGIGKGKGFALDIDKSRMRYGRIIVEGVLFEGTKGVRLSGKDRRYRRDRTIVEMRDNVMSGKEGRSLNRRHRKTLRPKA